MECINHAGKAAAGTCQSCGKGLCAECADRFSLTFCENCLLQHNTSIVQRLIFEVALTVIIFAGISIWLGMNLEGNKSASIVPALMAAGVWWGWQLINKIPMPLIIVPLPVMGMLYLFKLILAIVVGIFAMPIMLFLRIRDIIKISKLKKDVLAGKV